MELFIGLSGVSSISSAHPYFGRDGVLWSNAIGDAYTTLAFFLITFAIYYFIKKRKGLKIKRVFVLFAVFIFLCGMSHLLELISIWHPFYAVEGIIKMLTGVTAIATVIALADNIPALLKLPSAQQLADANAELEHKRDELKKQNEFLRNLAYSTYHDLREPVRGMAINSQALLSKHTNQLNPEITKTLGHIAQESKRMYSSIDSILKLTFLESEKYTFENTCLRKVIGNAENRLHDLIVHSDAQIKYNDLPGIEGNESLLGLMFENIIANSIRFKSGADPVIEIKAEEQDLFYVISVKDNGVGFNNQYRHQIFEMFKTLGNSPVYKGSGLGLAISKRIVELHGGSISAESAEGSGTVVVVKLPKQPKAGKIKPFKLSEGYISKMEAAVSKIKHLRAPQI